MTSFPDTRKLHGEWVCRNYPINGRTILQLPPCGFIHSLVMMTDTWQVKMQYQLTDCTETQILGRTESEGGMFGMDDRILALTFHAHPIVNVNSASPPRLLIWSNGPVKLDVLMMYYHIRG